MNFFEPSTHQSPTTQHPFQEQSQLFVGNSCNKIWHNNNDQQQQQQRKEFPLALLPGGYTSIVRQYNLLGEREYSRKRDLEPFFFTNDVLNTIMSNVTKYKKFNNLVHHVQSAHAFKLHSMQRKIMKKIKDRAWNKPCQRKCRAKKCKQLKCNHAHCKKSRQHQQQAILSTIKEEAKQIRDAEKKRSTTTTRHQFQKQDERTSSFSPSTAKQQQQEEQTRRKKDQMSKTMTTKSVSTTISSLIIEKSDNNNDETTFSSDQWQHIPPPPQPPSSSNSNMQFGSDSGNNTLNNNDVMFQSQEERQLSMQKLEKLKQQLQLIQTLCNMRQQTQDHVLIDTLVTSTLNEFLSNPQTHMLFNSSQLTPFIQKILGSTSQKQQQQQPKYQKLNTLVVNNNNSNIINHHQDSNNKNGGPFSRPSSSNCNQSFNNSSRSMPSSSSSSYYDATPLLPQQQELCEEMEMMDETRFVDGEGKLFPMNVEEEIPMDFTEDDLPSLFEGSPFL
eukprot:m.114651 g.114651  ORF g.114651 m.114651 type:complete len:500 (+) comp12825_c0_seq1:150-1649(+)